MIDVPLENAINMHSEVCVKQHFEVNNIFSTLMFSFSSIF